ncbi:COG4315 family predicted lipoprotein [Halostella salina]|uniref:COG4315 family predicted lipoprotein n=1 Tax=Halostella salina TaxID=1547897 RepID=UPI000EF83C6D|nr:hypothetical protein [Halostella salina]
MPPTRRKLLGATATTLAFAGCLGGGDDGDATDTETDTDASGMDGDTETTGMDGTDSDGSGMDDGATVSVRSHPDHGEVLVGPDGLMLYMFDEDTQGEGASTCSGGCAETWPPLTAEDPTAGDGVTAELTTFEREDGSAQVAANGWPLYYYAPDEEPGDATGQGVGDVWWVLAPDGTPVRGDGGMDSGTTGEDTTDSGPSYGVW